MGRSCCASETRTSAAPEQSIRYVLAPFSSIIDEDIIADLYSRWQSGFTTKGMIRLSESYVGLFEIPVDTLNIEQLDD